MSAPPVAQRPSLEQRALQSVDAEELARMEQWADWPGADHRHAPQIAIESAAEAPSLVDRFAERLVDFSEEELDAAKQPHPHAFQHDECGLFPIGEVSVIAAPGREGKTFATIALAVSYVLGTKVVGLKPQPDRCVLVYSAEDDRPQYARKVLARCCQLGQEDAARVRARIVVPDLQAPGMEAFQTIVAVHERAPVESFAVDAVIEALRSRMDEPAPPGLVVFETASTLSEAEEDNRAFKTMIRALRRIARTLQVAVVLVHHTSQAASSNLPDLNLSVADIRGATALAYNSRQNFLLVNLGSAEEPFPDNDARTILRSMVAPNAGGRVTALVPLDTSKAIDPPPVFFQWQGTPYGAALATVPVPPSLEGARWRKLRQLMQGQRSDQRQAARDDAQMAKVREAVAAVRVLCDAGKQATAKQVSIVAGHNPGWAAPYLELAQREGLLTCQMERVARAKNPALVYRPVTG